MLQYPNDLVVVLNRGNHECLAVNGSRCGGFQRELLDKYGAIWGPPPGSNSEFLKEKHGFSSILNLKNHDFPS